MRANNRQSDQLRPIKITRHYTKYAEGSVLIEFGETKIICTATIDDKVPPFLNGKNRGWLSAEYAMLPRATHSRNKRDSVAGKVNPRAQEISRLIGRSLRSCVDLILLGERQILVDCDVIQADGGTRTASITGAFIAVYDALSNLLSQGKIKLHPITKCLAAVSVGVHRGIPLLDLDYSEDSNCDSDINCIMFEDRNIVEIQGTAEGAAFSRTEMNQLLDLAELGINQLVALQKQALGI
ncbi:MAG: ribonuclease PH [Burkholderiales bacterium]|nr:ribonuclease PH [Burkholderiales bacterium]